MPVEFLTDDQVAAYSEFRGEPSGAELERFFFLDDSDRGRVEKRRGDHKRGAHERGCSTTYCGQTVTKGCQ